jgi:hypothetical protein
LGILDVVSGTGTEHGDGIARYPTFPDDCRYFASQFTVKNGSGVTVESLEWDLLGENERRRSCDDQSGGADEDHGCSNAGKENAIHSSLLHARNVVAVPQLFVRSAGRSSDGRERA